MKGGQVHVEGVAEQFVVTVSRKVTREKDPTGKFGGSAEGEAIAVGCDGEPVVRVVVLVPVPGLLLLPTSLAEDLQGVMLVYLYIFEG